MSREITPIALRHRSRWEAADAGLLLWRENFAFLLLFFALPLWLCAFGLRIIPERLRYLSWLLLWFIRPLFERSALHVISTRFFEKGAGLKRLCVGLPKTLFRGLVGDLSWRRFSPLRAAMMPVRALEGLKFRQGAERRRILKKGGIGFCSLLTMWSLAMEAILLVGGLIFFLITMELLQPGLFSTVKEIVDGWEIYIYAAWCINSMLIESLYVCMGFSLYLNSRIELEGWDIEIIFRRLAEKNRRKNPAQAALMIFLLGAFPLLPVNASAEENHPYTDAANSPASEFIYSEDVPFETLDTILASPDFGGEKDTWGIRLKPRDRQRKQPELNLNFAPFLEKIKRVFAIMLRILLIGLIIFLAILIIIRLRKYRGGRNLFNKKNTVRPIADTAGLSPQALLDQSLEFFRQGQLRYAWGFCIAAIFRSLAVYRGIVFLPGATEYDCLNTVRDALPEQSSALEGPVNHWAAYAYGGQPPAQDSYWQALEYCSSIKSGGETNE